MSERQVGWYWVKVLESGKWGCFFWNGVQWRGESGAYPDEMFNVVGPRIPTPDEPWQCVPVDLTPPMRRAGQHAKEHDCYIDGIYADIIAAAPKP